MLGRGGRLAVAGLHEGFLAQLPAGRGLAPRPVARPIEQSIPTVAPISHQGTRLHGRPRQKVALHLGVRLLRGRRQHFAWRPNLVRKQLSRDSPMRPASHPGSLDSESRQAIPTHPHTRVHSRTRPGSAAEMQTQKPRRPPPRVGRSLCTLRGGLKSRQNASTSKALQPCSTGASDDQVWEVAGGVCELAMLPCPAWPAIPPSPRASGLRLTASVAPQAS